MPQFLLFILNNDKFAVPINEVKEIRSLEGSNKLSHYAGAPDYIAGVLNLHDYVVPVVNLNKFYQLNGMGAPKAIVILYLENVQVGILVNHVIDILELKVDQIKTVPDLPALKKEYIQAIGLLNDEMILILNMEKLKTVPDLNEVVNDN